MRFESPSWLALLVIIPLLAFVFAAGERKGARNLERLAAARLLPVLGRSARWPRILRAVLVMLTVALLSLAMARPSYGYHLREIHGKGADILFAVDVSRSMLCSDIVPDRLTRAKLAAKDMLEVARGHRVGIIPFSREAFLQCPLTLDEAAVSLSLDALNTTSIPRQGTSLAGPIAEARKAFASSGDNKRILVIFTDGEDLEGNGLREARDTTDMTIVTIGTGTVQGAPVPVSTESGSGYIKDDSGTFVTSRMDPGNLEGLAAAGHGFYAPVGSPELLSRFKEAINKDAQNANGETANIRLPIIRYRWPLAAALVLLIAEAFIPAFRRKGGVALALLFLFLPAAPQNTDAANATALPTPATETAKNATAPVAPAVNPRYAYNKGVEAYDKGDYAAATKAFDQAAGESALANADLKKQIYGNAGAAKIASALALIPADDAVMPESADAAARELLKKAKADIEKGLSIAPEDAILRDNFKLIDEALKELDRHKPRAKSEEKKPQDKPKSDEEKEKKKDPLPTPEHKDKPKPPQKKDDNKNQDGMGDKSQQGGGGKSKDNSKGNGQQDQNNQSQNGSSGSSGSSGASGNSGGSSQNQQGGQGSSQNQPSSGKDQKQQQEPQKQDSKENQPKPQPQGQDKDRPKGNEPEKKDGDKQQPQNQQGQQLQNQNGSQDKNSSQNGQNQQGSQNGPQAQPQSGQDKNNNSGQKPEAAPAPQKQPQTGNDSGKDSRDRKTPQEAEKKQPQPQAQQGQQNSQEQKGQDQNRAQNQGKEPQPQSAPDKNGAEKKQPSAGKEAANGENKPSQNASAPKPQPAPGEQTGDSAEKKGADTSRGTSGEESVPSAQPKPQPRPQAAPGTNGNEGKNEAPKPQTGPKEGGDKEAALPQPAPGQNKQATPVPSADAGEKSTAAKAAAAGPDPRREGDHTAALARPSDKKDEKGTPGQVALPTTATPGEGGTPIDGAMTRADAEQLLKILQDDEKLLPAGQLKNQRQNTISGRDW